MRLKFLSCVAAMLALCLMALPAAAGGGKYRHGCCGGGYGYAYPAYTYTYGTGYYYRPYQRHHYGYRVHVVPSYSYRYAVPAYTYRRVHRRHRRYRHCW